MPWPNAYLEPTTDESLSKPLGKLAKKIEASSNFRFAWQLFRAFGLHGSPPERAMRVLNGMIEAEECHEFLSTTFDPMYDDVFEIETVHEHCKMEEAELELILATAAMDRLGAYSRTHEPAKPRHAKKVAEIFEALGSYEAFELQRGRQPSCEVCKDYDNHHFTNWFYGVAWDWCFVVLWHEAQMAWVGCLTDTD